MTSPDRIAIEQTFHRALEALVEQVKDDESIIAALLCGSLSHDRVWSKSDIDLVLVTIDDKKVSQKGISLYADGVNVHALLLPRAEFRKLAEGSLNNSFFHSFLAKGRLLYTHDDSLEELFERMKVIGERDTGLQLLRAGTRALGPIYKAHKWLLTRGDLDYTALWILYAATPLAQIEVLSRRQLMDREVIPQASKLNPEFFRLVYHDLLNAKKTRASVEGALAAIDAYMAERAPSLFAPVLEHLREVGEVRSCTEIEDHFQRNYDFSEVTTACEYLADQGIIGKAGVGARLTKRSTVGIEELAFFFRDA
jgi:uncharacterized protein